MKHILFVGYRKEPVLFAKERGYTVSVWSERTLPRSAQSSIDFLLIEKFPLEVALSHLIIKFCSSLAKIDAIIALTESSVVAAALLKKKILGIDEISLAVNCHDKFFMKEVAKEHGVLTTEYCLLTKELNKEQLIKNWGLPIYAKPRTSSGGRGLYKILNKNQLARLKHHDYLLEKAIHTEEMSIELLIYDKKIQFINLTKYFTHHSINIVPKTASKKQQKLLREFSEKIMHTYQINNGIVHIECFVYKESIILGELAIRPPGGYLMNLIQLVYGFNPWAALIDIALDTLPRCSQKIIQNAAVYIFHPGAGLIEKIDGIEKIKNLPGFYSGEIKKKPGTRLSNREGSGQSLGYFIFTAPEQQQLVRTLETAKKLLQIKLKSVDI